MNRASKIIMVGLAAAALFIMGYDTGEWQATQRERDLHDWHGSAAQAEDAAKRWAGKVRESPSQVMINRYARNTAFPDRNCIQLRLKGGVGGEPIYCYQANTLRLLEEYSDVE